MRNALIGTAIGYKVNQIDFFVRSYRKNNQDDLLLLIVDNIDSHLRNFAIENNVTLIPTFQFRHSRLNIAAWRFFYCLEILLTIPSINKVFLSDVRDVVFTRNPFSNTENKYLFLASEDGLIGHEPTNDTWLKFFFGLECFKTLIGKPVICAGTISGDKTSLIRLLLQLINCINSIDPEKIKHWGADQAALNYITHANLNEILPHLTLKKSGDYFISAALSNVDKMNINDERICTIHQWDRHPHLIHEIRKFI